MIEKKKKKMEKRVREVFGCEETKNKKRSFHSFTGNRSREGEKVGSINHASSAQD